MSTISSLTSSILQSAAYQVPGITSSSNQNSTTTSSSGTKVSLGNSPVPTLTYNSLGKMSTTQASQLEQTVSTQVDNAISQMFPSLQTNAATDPSAAIYSIIAGNPPSSTTSNAASLLSMLPNNSSSSGTTFNQAGLLKAIMTAQTANGTFGI